MVGHVVNGQIGMLDVGFFDFVSRWKNLSLTIRNLINLMLRYFNPLLKLSTRKYNESSHYKNLREQISLSKCRQICKTISQYVVLGLGLGKKGFSSYVTSPLLELCSFRAQLFCLYFSVNSSKQNRLVKTPHNKLQKGSDTYRPESILQ